MAVTCTKDKNLLTFVVSTDGRNRTYTFDMASGSFKGVSGRELQNTPTGLFTCSIRNPDHSFLIEVINIVTRHWGDGTVRRALGRLRENKEVIAQADRLTAIGLKASGYRLERNELNFAIENIRELAQLIQTVPDDERTLRNFQNYYTIIAFKKKFNLKEDEHCTADDIDYLHMVYRNLRRYSDNAYPIEHLDRMFPRLIYYMSKGLMFTCKHLDREAFAINMFNKLLKASFLLNMTELPKGDALRVFTQVYGTYEVERTALEERVIREYQHSKLQALSFENEKYQVVIPTTSAEIKDEAEQQNNCVFRLYYPRLCDQRTHIVFVRDKANLSKSLVTCEVDNDGDIVQFLLAHNCSIRGNQELIDFHKEYAKHLQKHW